MFDREGLLKCVLSWKEGLENVELTSRGDLWTPELGAWLSEVRLDGVTLSPPIEPEDKDKVRMYSILAITQKYCIMYPWTAFLLSCHSGY